MIVTPRDLSQIGMLLHGPKWRRWMADRLGKSERTIIRYEDGDTNIPRSVRDQLLELVRDHRTALEKFEQNLSGRV